MLSRAALFIARGISLFAFSLVVTQVLSAIPKELSVGGRLTRSSLVNGAHGSNTHRGRVSLEFKFFSADNPFSQITDIGSFRFDNVDVVSGIFNVSIPLSPSQISKIFPAGDSVTYISFTISQTTSAVRTL